MVDIPPARRGLRNARELYELRSLAEAREVGADFALGNIGKAFGRRFAGNEASRDAGGSSQKGTS
ncbi:hypothetical protein A5906_39700 [Bradyrhizobium sacchari]|nr:hypothetical protein A5906_39700 [Bradyrhizobium sacchari]